LAVITRHRQPGLLAAVLAVIGQLLQADHQALAVAEIIVRPRQAGLRVEASEAQDRCQWAVVAVVQWVAAVAVRWAEVADIPAVAAEVAGIIKKNWLQLNKKEHSDQPECSVLLSERSN
jgi:hypothetical protein